MTDSNAAAEFSTRHLLNNGLEAVRSGAEMLAPDASDRDLRIALREVSSGIELILKAILVAEHWSLVFDNPKQASLEAFNKGAFRSAGFDECVQRLADIAGVPVDASRKTHLSRMRDKRNRLEHLGILDNLFALRASIGGALHAVAGVLQDASGLGLLDDEHKSLHTELAVEFSEINDFVDARWKELGPQMARDGGDRCPACNQAAGKVDDGLVCIFCGTHTAAEEAADYYLEQVCSRSSYEIVKNGGDWPRHECPECEAEALIDTENAPERYRCFSCDARFAMDDLTECSECNRLFSSNDDGYDICSGCFGNKMDKDD